MIKSEQINKDFQLQNCYLKDCNGQVIHSGDFITFKSEANRLIYVVEYVNFHDKICVILYNPIKSYEFRIHYLNNLNLFDSIIVKMDGFDSRLVYLKKPWGFYFHLQRGIQIRSTWPDFPVLLCKNLFSNLPINCHALYNNYCDYMQWKDNYTFSKYNFVAALAKPNSKHLEVIFKQF